MTKEEAWAELLASSSFGGFKDGRAKFLYFWEPGENAPLDERLYEEKEFTAKDRMSIEDLAEAYIVVSFPKATGQTIVFGRFHGRWDANIGTHRHLIRHLVDSIFTLVDIRNVIRKR